MFIKNDIKTVYNTTCVCVCVCGSRKISSIYIKKNVPESSGIF